VQLVGEEHQQGRGFFCLILQATPRTESDPSRNDSPVVIQLAKPIPLAQFLENAGNAPDDSFHIKEI
jgi:hypothetical protein